MWMPDDLKMGVTAYELLQLAEFLLGYKVDEDSIETAMAALWGSDRARYGLLDSDLAKLLELLQNTTTWKIQAEVDLTEH